MQDRKKIWLIFGLDHLRQIFEKLFAKTWRGGQTNLKFCVLAYNVVHDMYYIPSETQATDSKAGSVLPQALFEFTFWKTLDFLIL